MKRVYGQFLQKMKHTNVFVFAHIVDNEDALHTIKPKKLWPKKETDELA